MEFIGAYQTKKRLIVVEIQSYKTVSLVFGSKEEAINKLKEAIKQIKTIKN